MIYINDITQWTKEYNGDLFDAVLCDPPYELGFMGKKWDSSGVAFNPETWQGIYNHMKPGAFLLAFGGTRTFHRLMVAIEDAGFEVRDVIMYVYGSGFPKSYDISKGIDGYFGEQRETVGYDASRARPNRKTKTGPVLGDVPYDRSDNGATITSPATDLDKQWDGYGTALKPAYEPIVIAMKPIDGTYANNAIEYGVAGLNIDWCRIEAGRDYQEAGWGERYGSSSMPNMGSHQTRPWVNNAIVNGRPVKNSTPSQNGRWPANLIHDGSDEVVELFPQSDTTRVEKPSNCDVSGSTSFDSMRGNRPARGYNENGSAARFFYTAKASKKERNAGLPIGMTNNHPTVKPLSVTEYLSRLILPPKRDTPRRILVPFSGSGSERIGALLAGWDEIVGVEMSPEYAKIDETRFNWWKRQIEIHGADIDKILKQKTTTPSAGSNGEYEIKSLF